MAITSGEKEKKGDERQPGNTGDAGSEEQSQGSEKKDYSQAEVDALIKGKLQEFADVNVEEYRALKDAKARQEREVLEKKGDFEKILAQTVKEKDEVIGQREKEITTLAEQLRTIRVDNTLLAAASRAKAINPAQIVTLLKGNVHYDQKTDQVEVRENGAPMYKSGKPVMVEQYVHDFLQANPHHLPAGPAGSGAGGGTMGPANGTAYTISAADAKDPAKYRAAKDAAEKAGQQLVIER